MCVVPGLCNAILVQSVVGDPFRDASELVVNRASVEHSNTDWVEVAIASAASEMTYTVSGGALNSTQSNPKP